MNLFLCVFVYWPLHAIVKCSLFFLFLIGYSGKKNSGSGSKFNCAARVGSGQTSSGTGRVWATILSPCRPLPISFGQKSWCNLWWPADLQRAHCKDCSILQVCTTQHQKDQALSDRACCTTSCAGPCHFQAGLLQCSSGWTSKHNQTSTNDSECTTGLQRAQKSPYYTSLYLLALATSCSSHPVQDTDACI